jgi:hypothetical protein
MMNSNSTQSTQHTPWLEALDFIVVNAQTGNACASFLLPRDAVHYVKWRRTQCGNGPTFEVRNADGFDISPYLMAQVEAANTIGAEEWARAQPGWPAAIAKATGERA